MYWLMITLCDATIPVLLIACGILLWKNPPKEINSLIGYRTKKSMENAETWQFANQYCGKLWWKTGSVILLPTILIHILFFNANQSTLGYLSIAICTIEICLIFFTVFATERALKANFK